MLKVEFRPCITSLDFVLIIVSLRPRSSLICWDVLRKRSTKLKKVYHRLLLVMSATDICLSFTIFLSTWPIPKDTPGAPWLASGNDATCTAQGFAQVFFMPSLFYNAYLSIYYVLVIVYSWPEHKIVPLEKCAHAFTLVFSCVTSFTALALDMYGSNFLVWCFIAESWNIQLAMNIAWQWAAFLVVFVNMGFLIWKIGQQFRTTQKYGEARLREAMTQEQEKEKLTMARASWRVSLSTRFRRKSSVMVKNPMASIKTQAALYALSFLFTESSNVIVSIAYYTNDGVVPAWVLQYALCTLPLQGEGRVLCSF
jgi:membrane protein implicated in regulation of membrane protease activity